VHFASFLSSGSADLSLGEMYEIGKIYRSIPRKVQLNATHQYDPEVNKKLSFSDYLKKFSEVSEKKKNQKNKEFWVGAFTHFVGADGQEETNGD
jgi:hypothetical protein